MPPLALSSTLRPRSSGGAAFLIQGRACNRDLKQLEHNTLEFTDLYLKLGQLGAIRYELGLFLELSEKEFPAAFPVVVNQEVRHSRSYGSYCWLVRGDSKPEGVHTEETELRSRQAGPDLIVGASLSSCACYSWTLQLT